MHFKHLNNIQLMLGLLARKNSSLLCIYTGKTTGKVTEETGSESSEMLGTSRVAAPVLSCI